MKLKKLIPGLLFFLFFCIHIFSACRTNSGYSDSDEIVTAGYLLSVAHPPGYPLQSVLTKLFTFIPVASIAFRANIMSGFFSALTLVMVYLVGVEVLQLLKKDTHSDQAKACLSLLRGDFKNELVCVTGVMVLGFSSQFWLYSSVAEVFALNNFLVILGIWLGLKWREEFRIENGELRNGNLKKEKKITFQYALQSRMTQNEIKYFILTCVVVGIGLSHVQTYVLFLPGFLLLFILTIKSVTNFAKKKKILDKPKSLNSKGQFLVRMIRNFIIKRIFLGVVLVIGSFLLVNFLLFWLNARQQNFSWYFPQNIKGLYQEVTRWVYTNYDLENGETASAYFSGFTLKKLQAIPMYLGFLNEHFSYIGLVLGVIGIYYFWKFMNRKLFWIFLTWFLFGGLLMGMYSGFQERRPGYLFYNSNVGMMQRQYLQGEVIWGIFILVGIWGIVKLFYKKTLLIVGFCGMLVGWMILTNYKIGVQRNTTIAHDYAKTVLSSAEKNSVIVCLYDFPCFSLIYLQEMENYRKDVIVVPRNRFFKYYFYERNPEYYAYNYLDQKDYVSALVYWNVDKKTTYLTDLTPGNYNFGMYDGTFFVVPHGYLFEVRKDVPEKIYESDYKLTQDFLAQKIDKRNYSLNGLGDLLANIHWMQANQYAILGNQEKAMENIFLAQKLNKDFVQSKNLVTEIATIKKNPLYEVGVKIFEVSDFINHAKQKEENGEINLALANYKRATFVEPSNKEARIMLADVYLMHGMIREGFEEYRRLNLMFSEDEEIEKVLNDLREKLGIKSVE